MKNVIKKMVDIHWCKVAVYTDSSPVTLEYLKQAIHYKCIVINNSYYNWPLDYHYPIKDLQITELCISSYRFNQPLNKLPKSLKKIRIISHNFNQSLSELPPSMEYININGRYFNQCLDNLPITLKILDINSVRLNQSFANLPLGLTNLYLSIAEQSSNENIIQIINLDELPPNLEVLYIYLPYYKLKFTQLQHLSMMFSKLKYLTLYFNMLEDFDNTTNNQSLLDIMINTSLEKINKIRISITKLDYRIHIDH